jgi:serine phosphatase RsbU (regulator of sigma subunit)
VSSGGRGRYCIRLTDRYTADELARLTDAQIARRELDLRNRRWLRVLLVAFAALCLIGLIEMAFRGPLTLRGTRLFLLNIVVALAGAVAARHLRRNVTSWVLLFCVAQFLAATAEEARWAFGGLVACLFAFFRLSTPQSLTLHAFMLATVIALSFLQPMHTDSPHFTPAYVTLLTLIVNALLIASAAVLQIAGTRRVRREIVELWREPLANAREQVRMRDELHYARQLQLSMLPESPPQLDWIELAAVSIPAAEVGGDYYDFFVDDKRLAIVACDVAGHGMQSGMVLAALRGGLITTLRRSMSTPAAVLDQLHDLVAHTSRRRMLAAAIVMFFDREARRMQLASAAHPPIILRRGGEAQVLDAFAPPLGVRLPFRAAERAVELQSGDTIVVHSDGVYESRNAAGEEYGLDRLQRFVASHPETATAEQLRDAIVRDAEQFRGRAQDDDVTVVVARIV